MIRCEPDKVRFIDPDAEYSLALVHTVDLSDERSVQQFVTLWTKGKRPDWSDRMPDHARDVYHRDPPWLPTAFPGKEQKGWQTHYHLNLRSAPTWDDLQPFLSELSPALRADLQAFFGV